MLTRDSGEIVTLDRIRSASWIFRNRFVKLLEVYAISMGSPDVEAVFCCLDRGWMLKRVLFRAEMEEMPVEFF